MPEKNKEPTLADKLRAPFHESEYEWRVQSASKKGDKVHVLCYVQARAVMNRLDEVCGIMEWQSAITYGPDGAVLCHLSLFDGDNWVTKVDGAPNTDIEAVKGGISSAFKRAANLWGIGRILYDLPSKWVPLQDHGDHYHKGQYWDAPRLPDWAVSGRAAGNTPIPPTPKQPDSYDLFENACLEIGARDVKGYRLSVAELADLRSQVKELFKPGVFPNVADAATWTRQAVRLEQEQNDDGTVKIVARKD